MTERDASPDESLEQPYDEHPLPPNTTGIDASEKLCARCGKHESEHVGEFKWCKRNFWTFEAVASEAKPATSFHDEGECDGCDGNHND
jgi:hypothetical protein